MKSLVPVEHIERRIYLIRGHKVMLDRDLAGIYGVTTRRLNEQVKRNNERFPVDFMFQLSPAETSDWMSQFATSNRGVWMGMRRPPSVFTEHGAIMLASVLNSRIAVNASIQVVRAFVKLRELVATHKELARKFSELEHRVESHDTHIQSLFNAIRELMEPPNKPIRKIGFEPEGGR